MVNVKRARKPRQWGTFAKRIHFANQARALAMEFVFVIQRQKSKTVYARRVERASTVLSYRLQQRLNRQLHLLVQKLLHFSSGRKIAVSDFSQFSVVFYYHV